MRALNATFGEVFGEPETYRTHPPHDAWFVEKLSKPHIIVLAALDGEEIVGGLLAYELEKLEQPRSEIYIYELAVVESRRRQGIPTALIDELRRIARDRGAWTIFVQADIVPEDEPARTLYRKLAWEEIAALHFDIAP